MGDKEPVEYRAASQGSSTAWVAGLIVSIMILVPVAILDFIGIVLVTGESDQKAAGILMLTASVVVLLGGIGISIWKRRYAPLAILLTAGCLILLMFGLCAGF